MQMLFSDCRISTDQHFPETVSDALVNLKTKSCQQLLHYDVVSPGLLVARLLSTLCSTNRHAKIIVLIQCADNQIQICESAQCLLAARFLAHSVLLRDTPK